MRRIISVLVENAPGALSRVVGLFSQRGYNIESLTVAPTEDETLSRLTLTTLGDDHKIEQITKHLNKLIDVVKLVDLTEGSHIERELMLIKVKASGAQRAEVKRCVDIFRGQIVDVTSTLYTIQITGASDKLDAFLQAVGDASIIEVVRTGVCGISPRIRFSVSPCARAPRRARWSAILKAAGHWPPPSPRCRLFGAVETPGQSPPPLGLCRGNGTGTTARVWC